MDTFRNKPSYKFNFLARPIPESDLYNFLLLESYIRITYF
jgi:hypothetical protein